MMENTLARIYRVKDTSLIPNTCEVLKIGKYLNSDKGEIQFLQKNLLKNSRFWVDPSSGCWWLEFFTEKVTQVKRRSSSDITENSNNYKQVFCIDWNTLPDITISREEWVKRTENMLKEQQLDNNKFDYDIARLAYIETVEFTPDIVDKVSFAIRKTSTITLHDYYKETNHLEHIDTKGLSYLTTFNTFDHFQRYVILLTLAYAYLSVMDQIGGHLSMVAEQSIQKMENNQLAYIHERIARFNARFFFQYPVEYKNGGLSQAWKSINQLLEIDKRHNELHKKITQLHHIVDLRYEKEAHQYEKETHKLNEKRNLYIAVLGIILAALQVVQIFT
ncbi:hypothetical protein F9B74_10065 [Pelistega sp. NLN82]|uniref:CorA-like Mg2+ transporter protein n=1 Tax=Pelistega ratti TaxID=2652177 RepID=A0A6L9Y8Y3_9BURK|nr:hypothetical protein [Pelistega ratti]NEN76645.1 hypothetical protein [Pelistega ratti]